MTTVNKLEALQAIAEFLTDSAIDPDWWDRHTIIEIDSVTRTLVLKVDNINHQEIGWIKDAMLKS